MHVHLEMVCIILLRLTRNASYLLFVRVLRNPALILNVLYVFLLGHPAVDYSPNIVIAPNKGMDYLEFEGVVSWCFISFLLTASY